MSDENEVEELEEGEAELGLGQDLLDALLDEEVPVEDDELVDEDADVDETEDDGFGFTEEEI